MDAIILEKANAAEEEIKDVLYDPIDIGTDGCV